VKPNQSVDVGFQCRSAPPIAAIAERIKAGALGKVAVVNGWYFAPASKEHPGSAGTPRDEYRLRNWLWDRALSGDILVEQNIHIIDVCNWILQSHPTSAIAQAGRNVISHMGDIHDNYQVIYTYPDDVHVNFSSTQFAPGHWFDAGVQVFGAKGIAEAPYSGPLRVIGDIGSDNNWTWSDPEQTQLSNQPATFAANGAFTDNLAFADRDKDRSFIESITSGKLHNQIELGVESARSAMLGRMAADQKREVTWNDLLAHGEQYKLTIDIKQFS
jgi:myo-inositol 2-dehydrogenase / D-chiro-inositol 1-dehydrogenase